MPTNHQSTVTAVPCPASEGVVDNSGEPVIFPHAMDWFAPGGAAGHRRFDAVDGCLRAIQHVGPKVFPQLDRFFNGGITRDKLLELTDMLWVPDTQGVKSNNLLPGMELLIPFPSSR